MMPHVLIYTAKDGLWYWCLVDEDDDIWCVSHKGYEFRHQAEEAWERVDGAIWISGNSPDSTKAIGIRYLERAPV
jgi:hypothetical protein